MVVWGGRVTYYAATPYGQRKDHNDNQIPVLAVGAPTPLAVAG
ncbi:MAG: hypothetical protein RMJ88_14490 [Thermogemmata sp.]|nr:hypothetical protein [Thermogemmata sp.]